MTRTDHPLTGHHGDWQERLTPIISMAREMSAQTDPQQMVQDYSRWMRQMMPTDGFVSRSAGEVGIAYDP